MTRAHTASRIPPYGSVHEPTYMAEISFVSNQAACTRITSMEPDSRDQPEIPYIPQTSVSCLVLGSLMSFLIKWQFKKRQREYFTGLLGRKWECDVPGHTICVPTEDNQHYHLSGESFMEWVEALVRGHLAYYQARLPIHTSLQCLGEATTSQPPDGLLWPKPSVDEPPTVRAVSVPPSRRRNVRSPTLIATASIRKSLSSHPSSGALVPGFYSGKAIEWFGQKCINEIEDVIIFKRCRQYQYLLKQWSSSKGDAAGRKPDKQFFAMLDDLLELSRSALPKKN